MDSTVSGCGQGPEIDVAERRRILDLAQDYHDHAVLARIDLVDAAHQPRGWLYHQIRPFKKDVYLDHELIVLTLAARMSKQLASHVQHVMAQLDISNSFLRVLTTDDRAADAMQAAADALPWNPGAIVCDVVPGVCPDVKFDHLIDAAQICLAPWTRLEIDAQGHCRPCCAMRQVIQRPDGTAFDVNHDTVSSVTQSQWLVDLRQKLIRGEQPTECQQCWQDEAAGIRSIRQHIAWDLTEIEPGVDLDAHADHQLHSLNLALGNTCNLRCRTCDERSSSSWAAELSRTDGNNQRLIAVIRASDWARQKSHIWQDLQDRSQHLLEINFTGGEPMLIRQQAEFVHWLIQRNLASGIRLRYTTNGTVWPAQLTEHWSQFRSVHVSISVDDIHQRFEYQRKGADWQQVCTNLQRYFDLAKHQDITVNCNTTVSNLNVYYLPEFDDWVATQQFSHVRLNVLYDPPVLALTNMPKSATATVRQRLESHSWSPQLRDQIAGILDCVTTARPRSSQDFITFVNSVDQMRQEHYAQYHPEMAYLIGFPVDLREVISVN